MQDVPESSAAIEPVWTQERLKNPHAVADKQKRVRDMFAAIAPRYDRNNRLHSLGIDQRWRKKAVKLSRLTGVEDVVDVACGTGDLAIAFRIALDRLNQGAMEVIGIDYTYEMLPVASRKALDTVGPAFIDWVLETGNEAHRGARLPPCIPFIQGDAQLLPLPDTCCDVVSIAFGIRNVADPMRALREFRRVLRPAGRLVVLEFSKPTNRLIRGLYDFYFNQIMTRTAAWIARDRTGAYRYLSASVETFSTREQMKADIEAAGFASVEVHPLTFGVAVIYVGFVK